MRMHVVRVLLGCRETQYEKGDQKNWHRIGDGKRYAGAVGLQPHVRRGIRAADGLRYAERRYAGAHRYANELAGAANIRDMPRRPAFYQIIEPVKLRNSTGCNRVVRYCQPVAGLFPVRSNRRKLRNVRSAMGSGCNPVFNSQLRVA